ncbi:hypothetical protein AAC387_Pa01g0092 [Persea americana]
MISDAIRTSERCKNNEMMRKNGEFIGGAGDESWDKIRIPYMSRFSSNSMELGRIACVYQPFSNGGIWKLGFSDAIDIDSREREGEMEGEKTKKQLVFYIEISSPPDRELLVLTSHGGTRG